MASYTRFFRPCALWLKQYCKDNKLTYQYYTSDCVKILTDAYCIYITESDSTNSDIIVEVFKTETNSYGCSYQGSRVLNVMLEFNTELLKQFMDSLNELLENCKKHLEIYRHNISVEMDLLGIKRVASNRFEYNDGGI